MIGSYGEFVTAHPSCSSVLYEIPFVAISLHRNLAQMSNRHVTTLFQPVLHPVKKVALPFHFYCEMVKTSRAKIGSFTTLYYDGDVAKSENFHVWL